MRLDGVVAATNEILTLGHASSASDLQRACAIGCRELTLMRDDDAFQAVLAGQLAGPCDPEVQRVLNNLSTFAAFVHAELRELVAAGLEAAAAEALLNQVQQFRQTMGHIRMNPTTVQVGLTHLRDEVCGLATLFGDASVDENRRRTARTVLRRVAWVAGGAAIVIVNATVTSMIPPYPAASATVGAGLVVYGLKGG